VAVDFDVQLQTRGFRSGAGIPAVLLKAFLLLEEVVLVGRERPVGGGRGERIKGARRKRGVVKFVENVDGEEGVFRVAHAAELDAFRVVPGGEARFRAGVCKFYEGGSGAIWDSG